MRHDEIVECGERAELEQRLGGGVELPTQRFVPGQEVMSEIIGRGRVESVDVTAGEYKIYFYALDRVRTMSYKAPLQALSAESAAVPAEDKAVPSAK